MGLELFAEGADGNAPGPCARWDSLNAGPIDGDAFFLVGRKILGSHAIGLSAPHDGTARGVIATQPIIFCACRSLIGTLVSNACWIPLPHRRHLEIACNSGGQFHPQLCDRDWVAPSDPETASLAALPQAANIDAPPMETINPCKTSRLVFIALLPLGVICQLKHREKGQQMPASSNAFSVE